MKSEHYCWDDVIINPFDERLKVGEKYYMEDFPSNLADYVEGGDLELFPVELVSIEYDNVQPFRGRLGDNEYSYTCCMKIKEKTVRPYDFNDPEVRKALMGTMVKRITDDELEGMITGFYKTSEGWYAIVGSVGFLAQTLCDKFVFCDKPDRKVGVYEK